jgi:hypothetical protein
MPARNSVVKTLVAARIVDIEADRALKKSREPGPNTPRFPFDPSVDLE